MVAAIPDRLKQQTIAEADEILQHRFRFRGIEHGFAGEVEWQACPQENVSWRWDLNRHRCFVTLGTAYYYSGREEYLAKLLALWTQWVERNPVSRTSNWQQPFEVASRLNNWIWAYFLLESSGKVEQGELARFAAAMEEHGRFLYSRLEYHWPNNHLLLEAKALYGYALLFERTVSESKLLARAARILTREVAQQILPDGAHAELCSMYHRIIAGELGELTLLCRRRGRPLSATAEQRILEMVKFSGAMLRQDGTMPLLGDSALSDTNIRFDFACLSYSDLNYWLGWRDHYQEFLREPSSPQPKLRIFPDAGYAFLRDKTNVAFHLTFDFGSFSCCSSPNHGHCDALSFELYGGGRALIIDPGAYLPWNDGGQWAHYFRSTAAHNTLRIDGHEQSEPCEYSDIGQTARTTLLGHDATSIGTQISAECVPYWGAANGIRHVRKISQAPARVTIADRVLGSGQHRLEWFFHFPPELEAVQKGRRTVTLQMPGSQIELLRLRPTVDLSLTVVRGQIEPRLGWVSRNSAQVVPAHTAVDSAEVELPFSAAFQLKLPTTTTREPKVL